MDTPNKIYIAVYPNNDGLDTHLGDWYSEPEFHAEDNLEYINKDAILEWIEGKMTIEEETEGYFGGYDAALKEVIDKIGSL